MPHCLCCQVSVYYSCEGKVGMCNNQRFAVLVQRIDLCKDKVRAQDVLKI